MAKCHRVKQFRSNHWYQNAAQNHRIHWEDAKTAESCQWELQIQSNDHSETSETNENLCRTLQKLIRQHESETNQNLGKKKPVKHEPGNMKPGRNYQKLCQDLARCRGTASHRHHRTFSSKTFPKKRGANRPKLQKQDAPRFFIIFLPPELLAR